VIAHEYDQQRRGALEVGHSNHFPAWVRQPEVRRPGAQRQHCGINGNHAEKLLRRLPVVEWKKAQRKREGRRKNAECRRRKADRGNRGTLSPAPGTIFWLSGRFGMVRVEPFKSLSRAFQELFKSLPIACKEPFNSS
jgi:hypothetical protein